MQENAIIKIITNLFFRVLSNSVGKQSAGRRIISQENLNLEVYFSICSSKDVQAFYNAVKRGNSQTKYELHIFIQKL